MAFKKEQLSVRHLGVILNLLIYPSTLPSMLDYFKILQQRLFTKEVEALRYLHAANLRFTDEDDTQYVMITANLGNMVLLGEISVTSA